jgi:protein FRA10AC1
MRWRVLEEVKAGKGETVCAEVGCARREGLDALEVVFGYVEGGERREVLVKCVLCEKCGRRMRRAKETDEKRGRKTWRRETQEKPELKPERSIERKDAVEEERTRKRDHNTHREEDEATKDGKRHRSQRTDSPELDEHARHRHRHQHCSADRSSHSDSRRHRQL